jgi:hypothetical protein
MLNIFIKDYEWSQSKPRQIDDETLIDLLRICEYEAERLNALEDIGFQDNASSAEALYMYVLDALGVPPIGHKKMLSGEVDRFSRECVFDREWFDELFYQKKLLENDKYNYSHRAILEVIRNELQNNIDRHYK